ncbi:MAG: ATP-dependent DNA helicase [Sphingomonadales bacterium]
MSEAPITFPNPIEALLHLPVLMVWPRKVMVLDKRGLANTLSIEKGREVLSKRPHLICNTPLVAGRLNLTQIEAFDVLELFAFVRPAEFVVPTPKGLAEALGLSEMEGNSPVEEAHLLKASAQRLIENLQSPNYKYKKAVVRIAMFMARAGWIWGPIILGAVGTDVKGGLHIWSMLNEWSDKAPSPSPGQEPVNEDEAIERLTFLLGKGAEERLTQKDYTKAACYGFSPKAHSEAPNIIVLEAGTGIGKTLGYIAPATVWAEKNQGTVWLSTYTKNLQRQIDQELLKLYPEQRERNRKAVVRKGRENYLCLLNLEEATQKAENMAKVSSAGHPQARALLGLVLRWVLYSRDGDMVGGDFPGWLASHIGRAPLRTLTDRRGECVYSACDHYRKCFIEKTKRRARDADLVISNHALSLFEATLRQDDPEFPRHFVFDEGHHLFEAADSAFSIHISGQEGAELRRWLRGREGKTSGRGKGLTARIETLIDDDNEAKKALREILKAALLLPDEGWLRRLNEAEYFGPFETFLGLARAQVYARSRGVDGPHSIEASTEEPIEGLVEGANDLRQGLFKLAKPLSILAFCLKGKLDNEASELETGERVKIEAISRSLNLKAQMVKDGWISMLEMLGGGESKKYVDWFSVERIEGREIDVGFHRHWLDPTEPLAKCVLEPAAGVIITSATLRDIVNEEKVQDWDQADVRLGASHLIAPPKRQSFASPFDYKKQAKVFIVTDINRDDPDQVASAYRELFLASGGHALGLFTAIHRLKSTYHKLIEPITDAGLTLLAQHIDTMDTGTLVDIFRHQPKSILLGTDALRDGVDVPGEALKLLVFDRIPWPRPNILHKRRRAAFGKNAYDDMVTRLRLKQAFGRLIRRDEDKGVFVMLDARTPTRLLSAFPEGVGIKRLGLKQVIDESRLFFKG